MKLENKSVPQLEKTLWKQCRDICLITLAKHGKVDCYTCPQKDLQGANCQLGHGYPKGALGALMKYCLDILRWQCYNCNINLGGMGAIFWKNLERDLGKKRAGELYKKCQASKGKPIKARDYYMALIKDYREILAELQ